MPNESEAEEEPSSSKTLDTWMPNVFQEEPGYSYYLFTPTAHRAWIAAATQVIEKWSTQGDGTDNCNLKLIKKLLDYSQGEAYDENFESDDPHLKEQAHARWQQRHELLLTLMTYRNASDMLRDKKLGGDEGQFMRAAAIRFVDLGRWGDEGPSEEYEHLRMLFEPY